MSEWVEILVTYDMTEAEIVQGLLQSGGIEAVVRSAKVTPYPVNVGKMGEVKVLVRRDSKEAAEMLIQEASASGPPESDREDQWSDTESRPGGEMQE